MNNGIMQCGRKLYDSRVESRILDRQHTGSESHHMNLMMFIEKKLYGRKKKERASGFVFMDVDKNQRGPIQFFFFI